jgi:hypothetical protein
MFTRIRRRSVLALAAAAATAALTAATGAAPAAAEEYYVHSFRFTLSAANTKALTDRGIVVIPIAPVTRRVDGSGDSRTITLTLPVTGRHPNAGSFPMSGGVWFLNTRTWRGLSVTRQHFDFEYPFGNITGAISSRGGARMAWLVGSPQFPGVAGSDIAFRQELNRLAGADVVVAPPGFGSLQQCTNGPCP